MRILGLVTARGGSKGLPGKNLAPLAGRPLAAWSHAALDELRQRCAELPDIELVVRLSTDEPAIAATWPEADRPAPGNGGLRPAHLATDEATSLSVVEHELGLLESAGTPADAVLLLQPTSPLLRSGDLLKMIRALRERHRLGASCSVALITELDHPLAWSLTLDDNGVVRPAATFDAGRRQTQPRAYRPVGCYLATAEFVRTHKALALPGETLGVAVPRRRAVDIDDAADLATARALLGADSGARTITVGERTIGPGHACFVIAEAGVNHNGDPALAHRLVDAAADAGADAVKFQTFRASSLVTAGARMAAYQKTNLRAADGADSQAAMLASLELDAGELASLKAHAERRGLLFLSSPFDTESAEILGDLGVPALKLGSGELTNHPFLAKLARMGLPLLLSTGMATLSECEDAAAVLRAHGDPDTLWFHCVSAYPAPEAASNLRAMDSIRDALGVPVGMSDHSMGDAVTIAAVARGACAIEKHLTLDRTMEGPDHAASLEPDAFGEMVRRIRLVEAALGDGVKRPAGCELDTIRAARRSLVAARDLPSGHVLTEDDLTAKRPGDGIPPARLADLIGRTLASAIAADEQLTEGHLTRDASARSVA